MANLLTEFKEATTLFNTMSDEELSYAEGELLGFAYFVNGKINLIDEASETPYIKVGNHSYISDTNIKAKYRNGLVRLIKKGYTEKWKENIFILTAKGWDKAKMIVNDIYKYHL